MIGKNYDDSKERIILSSLNIGRVSFDSSVLNLSDSLNAQVYQQSHAYEENSKIAPGSRINLWLTTDSIKIKDAKAYIKNQLLK